MRAPAPSAPARWWRIRAGFLTPGMFGHMRRFEAQAAQAMLIPDESVVNDQTRQVAYVVGEDGVVGTAHHRGGPADR